MDIHSLCGLSKVASYGGRHSVLRPAMVLLPLDAHWASVTDLPSFDLFKVKFPSLLRSVLCSCDRLGGLSKRTFYSRFLRFRSVASFRRHC